MKKITLILSALALSLSVLAQSKLEGAKMINYERYKTAKEMLSTENSEEAKYYLGLAELGEGNNTTAQQIFQQMASTTYGQAGLARVYFAEGKKADAEKLLNDIIDGAKRRDYDKYRLAADAITYSKGGNINQAIEWYLKSMEKEETSDGLVALGDAYLQLPTEAGKAATAWEKAINLDPKNSLAHARIGKLWYDARNYEKALTNFEEAKTADPNNPLPYRDLANAYYNVGKYELAKQNIEKYLSLSDKTGDNRYTYINILFLSKDYPAALAKVNELIATEKNPKAYVYRLRAYTQYENKEYDNARMSINEFFSREKDPKKILFDDYKYAGDIFVGVSTTDTAKKAIYLDSAQAYYMKAVANDTAKVDKYKIYRDIAESYQQAKAYDKAGDWFTQVISKDTAAASLDYYYAGYYSYFGGNYPQAEKAFNQMYDKFEADRFFSEYWRGLVAAANDKEAKTGIAAPFFKNWLTIAVPEGKTRTNDQLMKAYQYLTFYYYNTKNAVEANKYAAEILKIEPANEFATSVKNFFAKK